MSWQLEVRQVFVCVEIVILNNIIKQHLLRRTTASADSRQQDSNDEYLCASIPADVATPHDCLFVFLSDWQFLTRYNIYQETKDALLAINGIT